MNIEIKKLETIDAGDLEKISTWMYDWWGKAEGYTFEVMKCYMENSVQKDRFPYTYGLFLDDKLIGMYQIRLDDLFVRPDLYPWLANVYIDVAYRNNGYARLIMESIKANAQKCREFKELYLYTVHKGLYEKYGWEYICEIDTFLTNDRIQRLYKLDL